MEKHHLRLVQKRQPTSLPTDPEPRPQVFRRPGPAAQKNFDDALEVVPVVYELAKERDLSRADLSFAFRLEHFQ